MEEKKNTICYCNCCDIHAEKYIWDVMPYLWRKHEIEESEEGFYTIPWQAALYGLSVWHIE